MTNNYWNEVEKGLKEVYYREFDKDGYVAVDTTYENIKAFFKSYHDAHIQAVREMVPPAMESPSWDARNMPINDLQVKDYAHARGVALGHNLFRAHFLDALDDLLNSPLLKEVK